MGDEENLEHSSPEIIERAHVVVLGIRAHAVGLRRTLHLLEDWIRTGQLGISASSNRDRAGASTYTQTARAGTSAYLDTQGIRVQTRAQLDLYGASP